METLSGNQRADSNQVPKGVTDLLRCEACGGPDPDFRCSECKAWIGRQQEGPPVPFCSCRWRAFADRPAFAELGRHTRICPRTIMLSCIFSCTPGMLQAVCSAKMPGIKAAELWVPYQISVMGLVQVWRWCRVWPCGQENGLQNGGSRSSRPWPSPRAHLRTLSPSVSKLEVIDSRATSARARILLTLTCLASPIRRYSRQFSALLVRDLFQRSRSACRDESFLVMPGHNVLRSHSAEAELHSPRPGEDLRVRINGPDAHSGA